MGLTIISKLRHGNQKVWKIDSVHSILVATLESPGPRHSLRTNAVRNFLHWDIRTRNRVRYKGGYKMVNSIMQIFSNSRITFPVLKFPVFLWAPPLGSFGRYVAPALQPRPWATTGSERLWSPDNQETPTSTAAWRREIPGQASYRISETSSQLRERKVKHFHDVILRQLFLQVLFTTVQITLTIPRCLKLRRWSTAW